MNLSRLRTAAIRTSAGARQAIALAVLASTARGDLVHTIQCGTCGTWVKPRQYDPTYNTCQGCLPAAKAEHRAHIRDNERRLGLI